MHFHTYIYIYMDIYISALWYRLNDFSWPPNASLGPSSGYASPQKVLRFSKVEILDLKNDAYSPVPFRKRPMSVYVAFLSRE